MTTNRAKTRMQVLFGDGQSELQRASSKTLLYLGQNSHPSDKTNVEPKEPKLPSTTSRPRALSKKLSRLQILLGTEQGDASRLSAKSKRYLLKDSVSTGPGSSAGPVSSSKVTPLLNVNVQDERITNIATPPSESRDSTASGTRSGPVCMPSRRQNPFVRLLIALGLMSSSCVHGAYTAGVTLTFTTPPFGVLGPIQGQVTGLPGGPGLYKGIVVFNGQCNIWWDKGHNAYRWSEDPATAQNAGLVLDAQGRFTITGEEYQTSPFDVQAGRIAVFIVPQTTDLSWPAYVMENYYIHDYVWNDAVTWLFVDRTQCTDQALPCTAENGAYFYTAQRPTWATGDREPPDPATNCGEPYGPPPAGVPVIPGGPIPNVPPPPTPSATPTSSPTPTGSPTPSTSGAALASSSPSPTASPARQSSVPSGFDLNLNVEGSSGASVAHPTLLTALACGLLAYLLL